MSHQRSSAMRDADTSSIICFLHLNALQRNARMDGIDLVSPTCRSETQKVVIEKADHVLPHHSILSLPADMQDATKRYVPKGAYSVPRSI